MRKFLFHILLFCLLPLGISIIILLQEPERKQQWTGYTDDCDNRGTYLWQRIFQDTTPIDMAFLGTSHTINGIMDTLIERGAQVLIRKDYHVVNLGYCRFGNEMQYIIAKDLFANKKPQIVVIEINERFGRSSHPMYPYYAQNAELLSPPSYLNRDLPGNVYNGFLARLSEVRNDVYQFPSDSLTHFPIYGYRGYPGAADPVSLSAPEQTPSPVSENTWATSYSKAWIQSTVELCKANNAQVYFVYMPAFHDQPIPVEGMDFYQKLAPVLMISGEEIHDKSLWRENDHFNNVGAQVFSEWLCESLLGD